MDEVDEAGVRHRGGRGRGAGPPLVVHVPHGQSVTHMVTNAVSGVGNHGNILGNHGDRLCDVLERLDASVKENTLYLKGMKTGGRSGGEKQAIEEEPDDELLIRTSKVDVETRVTFLRIIDVDTVNQSYTAEVFIQAKWGEPRLEEVNEEELDDIKWDEYWDPKLVITNIDGEPDEDQVWRRARMDAAVKRPVMIYRRRVRCKLKENLELQNFPVDVQELTIQVSSDRTSNEVNLIEDRRDISTVAKGSFTDEHEWELFKQVEVVKKEAESSNVMNSRYKHPKLDCMCYVGRRPGYFFWNVILIMLLINLLTFTSFSISPDKPQSRLGVTLTLLLTAVAFKFVVNQSLPRISYLTYLDIYVLSGMVFLCLQAVQNAIVSLYVSSTDTELTRAKDVDFYFMIVMGIILAVFHIVFFTLLGVKGISARRDMRRREADYEQKKKKMAKMLKSRDSVFLTKSSKKVSPDSSQPTTKHNLSSSGYYPPAPAGHNGHGPGERKVQPGGGYCPGERQAGGGHGHLAPIRGTYAQLDPAELQEDYDEHQEHRERKHKHKKHKKDKRARFNDVESQPHDDY